MLAIAIEKSWVTAHLDVKCACLNSKLTEEVYMEQPTHFEELDPQRYLYRLKKSIYGLHQSDRHWNDEIVGRFDDDWLHSISVRALCMYYNEE